MLHADRDEQRAHSSSSHTELLREWMSAVGEVTRAVNSAEPLHMLLSRIAEHACRLIGFEFCAVMLPDPAEEWLVTRGWHGLSPEYVRRLNRDHALVIHPETELSDTLAARAFREGRTFEVSDAPHAEGYGLTRRQAAAEGFGALVSCPLLARTGPVGVIVAYSSEPRQFSAAEVELVELLAQQSTLALEAAQLRATEQQTIAELEHKRRILEAAEAQHRKLMQLVLDEAGLQGLANHLAGEMGVTITIEDPEGTALAVSSQQGTVPAPDAATRRRNPLRDALRTLHERYELVNVRLDAPENSHAWVVPVIAGGQIVGHMWGTGLDGAPDTVERRVIERFTLVVALELLKRRYRIETENRLAGDLISALLRAGAGPVSQRTRERASALGHDLSGEQLLAVVSTMTGLAEEAARLAEAIRLRDRDEPRPLVGCVDSRLVVILPADETSAQRTSRIHDLVSQLLGSARLETCIAPVTSSNFASAYSLAAGAGALRLESEEYGCVDIRDMGLVGYLLRTDGTEELKDLSERLLGPVERYDHLRQTNLLGTLRSWLDAGCSVPVAAAELVVHPNTVTYRLGRIERLIGRDLRRQAVRLELQLALQVRDIQRLVGESPNK